MTLSIYVADLADYNAGILTGNWFDLDDFDHPEELQAAISALLHERTQATGILHEEWAVHDYDLPIDISEWPDFALLFQLKEAVLRHGAEIVTGAFACGIPLDEIPDRYLGTYCRPEYWAEEVLSDQLASVPLNLLPYMDYERFARDEEWGGSVYFHRTPKHQFAVFSLI